MKTTVRLFSAVLLFSTLSSCGIPTAAVRTARNALKEVSSIYDGTSSAYADVQ